MLIEFMMRLETALYLIVFEEHGAGPCILRKMRSASFSTLMALNVISSRFPTGVGTIYNIPAIVYLTFLRTAIMKRYTTWDPISQLYVVVIYSTT